MLGHEKLKYCIRSEASIAFQRACKSNIPLRGAQHRGAKQAVWLDDALGIALQLYRSQLASSSSQAEPRCSDALGINGIVCRCAPHRTSRDRAPHYITAATPVCRGPFPEPVFSVPSTNHVLYTLRMTSL